MICSPACCRRSGSKCGSETDPVQQLTADTDLPFPGWGPDFARALELKRSAQFTAYADQIWKLLASQHAPPAPVGQA